MKIPFVGPTYAGRSSNINAQRCVNWYVELDQLEGKSPRALINTPGAIERAVLPQSPVRGLYVVRSGASSDETLYAVGGTTFYKLDTDYAITSLGTLAASTGLVSMTDNGADNGDELLLSEGLYKGATPTNWLLTLSTDTLTNLSAGGQPLENIPLSTVGFLDGRFIGIRQNTGQYYISGSYDGTSWNALDFATAESSPDNLVGMIIDHQEIWLFGEVSTEVWANTGASDFPFRRIPGAVIEWGCASQHSVAKADNAVYWLGRNTLGTGHVLRAVGYQAEVISTPAIEFLINSLSTITDAQSFTYQQEGHSFYVLTFPTAGRTIAYDMTTGLWHERSSSGLTSRWRANCYAFFNGKHLIGDSVTGSIYELDLDTYTDAGGTIQRMRRTQVVADDLQRLFFSRLQIDFESGVGLLPSQQGDDPKVMVRWSDDGGHTWSNELQASIGKIGEYGARAIIRRLGSARQRIFEVKITDPVKPILIGAHARVMPGAL